MSCPGVDTARITSGVADKRIAVDPGRFRMSQIKPKFCIECGKDLHITHMQVRLKYCPECKRIIRKKQQNVRNMKISSGEHVPKHEQIGYTLVMDPSPDPLAKGMNITCMEIGFMLEMHSFTPGTILRSAKTNELYVVESRGNYPQILKGQK